MRRGAWVVGMMSTIGAVLGHRFEGSLKAAQDSSTAREGCREITIHGGDEVDVER